MTNVDRLFAEGKKKVLTLDGGGVRGIVSVAFLKEIEITLRNLTGKNDYVLSDFFDLVAGTSVGSMLGTMVSLGFPVEEIEAKFRDLAPKIFSGRDTFFGQKRFDARNLVNGVRSIVKDRTLGSEDLLTGLVIIAKRVDTGAVWVMSNNPKMPFFHHSPEFKGNKDYKLESIIRASTAAPFLFSPTKIRIHVDDEGNETNGDFVDGGVSPHNNPSYQALLMAGLPAYKLNWHLNENDLLMISVGTGIHRTPVDPSKKSLPGVVRGMLGVNRTLRDLREDIEEAAFTAGALRGMISDASLLTLKSMQAFSNPRFSWTINGEVDSLDQQVLEVAGLKQETDLNKKTLLSFQRYDLPLELRGYVSKELDVRAEAKELATLHAIDDPSKLDRLYELASDVAARQVNEKDFKAFLS